MWFLQVDGDGFESLSTVKPNTLAAEVMLDDVFLRYPLPYTVSIIVASLTHDYAVEKPTPRMELARRILNLPHVEPASHGVLHTLRWQAERDAPGETKALMSFLRLANYEYGTVAEVRDSIRFINERLLEPPRRCAVMLWTGSADPHEESIRAAVDAGSWNVNGGVFRWDAWSDSVGFVSPWSRRAGAMLQVYAGAANENDFDGFFDTMPGAFGHITTTIERTGSPRVLKPADVYAHFYSAESPARLKSIHDLIERWALREPTAPVHASTYAKAVHSAVFRARVLRRPDGWALRRFDDCRTARIDGETRDVDFSRSLGLLGARRVADSLYLHLAGPDAIVVLAAKPPARPHVAEANCLLEYAELTETGVAVTATAWNPRLVRFAGFPPRARLRLRLDDVEREETADPQGELLVRLPAPGTTRVEAGLR
jgi:hypothetical protein